ncbi:Ras family small GTPase (macronuclear) [Tetrahymena thermophila SB210]|uniref:Ras family small GTPase n=1 Tax=Tetrahymena thermophila (strain SB210) TaxID=312017 RepID=Q247T2_TETTS|nr:Ras family small GTPase [Tetrahymena thermophila SB210]EAS04018.2 Ras family small GTPase [Tetrahymena thermophila SB210]|eukprot:XP_001024263.2 Ras family small GTPase [Tetrahymena thermophila SB210]
MKNIFKLQIKCLTDIKIQISSSRQEKKKEINHKRFKILSSSKQMLRKEDYLFYIQIFGESSIKFKLNQYINFQSKFILFIKLQVKVVLFYKLHKITSKMNMIKRLHQNQQLKQQNKIIKSLNYASGIQQLINKQPGQKILRCLVLHSYEKTAQGAILIYDITNRENFLNISGIIKQIRDSEKSYVPLILVGNKFDLEQNREVSYTEGENFAKEHDLFFFEVSAFTGYNIEVLFNKITELVLKQVSNLIEEKKITVGKSCIVLQASENKFKDEHDKTIGVEFLNKIIQYDNKIFKLSIWDTAGQSRFRSIVFCYFEKAQGVILVYDITNRESFLNISEFIQKCRERTRSYVPLILVGNKFDLEQNRQVSYTEGENFAKKHDLFFFEVSAYTGYNIDELFNKITELVYENQK